jgi:hypothetical protein
MGTVAVVVLDREPKDLGAASSDLPTIATSAIA